MKHSYPHVNRSGPTVTIEARTMAEADAAAEAELGPGFTVTSVRRLRRGGVGGFFALELVELVASTPGAASDRRDAEMASAEDLLRGLQRNEGDFATRLIDRMGEVDPDTMTLQQLFTTARAAGVPDEHTWDEVAEMGRRPSEPVLVPRRDPGTSMTAAPEAGRRHAQDPLTTNELPVVTDAIGPDPADLDAATLLRRRPRGNEGPLAEMPPPALHFDDDTGRWTVDSPSDATPAAIPPTRLPDETEAAAAEFVPAESVSADFVSTEAVPAEAGPVSPTPPPAGASSTPWAPTSDTLTDHAVVPPTVVVPLAQVPPPPPAPAPAPPALVVPASEATAAPAP